MKELVPNVKKRTDHPGTYAAPASVRVLMPYSLSGLQTTLQKLFAFETTLAGDADLQFIPDAALAPESYRLTVAVDHIEIAYRDYAGAFYGLTTLIQLRSRKNVFPLTEIEDGPDMEFRGFMMDISRDKIPTVDTLKAFIDKMAAVKMNHLELYVEGFSFDYPSFPGVNEGETPLTLTEFLELERYAALHAIDLCGNMNSFGHMTKWLERPEYRKLAECPHGFEAWGYHFPPSTLNPLDPASLLLVEKMHDELLPHSHSPYFNINCDEPFELSKGKSKKACERKGIGNVYVDYVSHLVEHVNHAGKTALVWGDVLIHHPEVLPRLPSGLVFLDWGYDYDYPFEEHMKKLSELQVKFVGCPGTSSWNSFASRKRDMLATTKTAAECVKKYGGMGLMITDWGDMGHLQYLPFSYPGLIYAGLTGWEGPGVPEEAIQPVLSAWLNPVLATGILDLAGYSRLENRYTYNSTLAFAAIMFSDPSTRHPRFLKKMILKKALGKNALSADSRKQILDLLAGVERSVREHGSSTEEEGLVKAEILQTIRLIQIGVDANLAVNRDPSMGKDHGKQALSDALETALEDHSRLWNQRNKTGGLDRSSSRLIVLKSLIETL